MPLKPKIITPVYIDDIIGEIVQATSAAILLKIQQNEAAILGTSYIQQIRYSQSGFGELVETLAQLDKSGEERYNKYPIVHLVQDVAIDRGQDTGIYGGGGLNIVFIHQTRNTYKAEERSEKVFKPVLYPIYYEFLEQAKKSKWIFATWDATGEFRHRVIERHFWGNRKLSTSENILNDFVDALEVQNLQIKFNFSNC